MYSTNVPPITWSNTGLTLPLESAILGGVLADMNAAFGGNMSQSLSSPQGQLAQNFAACIGFKNNNIAYIASQMDPATADGRFQDGIGYIYFLQRIAASGTLVQCNCVGLVGTVIPAGSLAQDANGYLYASTADATIPASGTVSVTFQCLTSGPVQVNANTLTQIYKAVNGWDAITNPAAGTPGVNVETRTAFEARRKLSVANNAVNSSSAIWGTLLKLPGVVGVYVVDNPTPNPVTIGSTNYSLAANSIVASVYGGIAQDVANAIWSKKPPGIPTVGNTAETITDTTNVQTAPYPTYTINFLTPTATPLYVDVTLAASTGLPANIASLVQQAILDVFNGVSNYSSSARAQQMSTINAGSFYAAIYALSPYVDITALTIGSTPSPTGTSVSMGLDQMPTLQASDITVTT